MNGDPNLTKDKLLSFLVRPAELLAHAEAIRPQLKRYPAVDDESFIRRVKKFLEGQKDV